MYFYPKVLNESTTEGTKTPFSKKKLPKEAIELDEIKRGDPSWINAVVEVGLNNPLLQSGHLEVIDAPGMSENESLDKIVHEYIHGVLQVIIYVIDGNSSLRLQVSGNATNGIKGNREICLHILLNYYHKISSGEQIISNFSEDTTT